jgi:hypothetical protein
MKKLILPIVASGILFFSACTNDNSSTVAPQDDEEQSSSSHSGSKEHHSDNQQGSHTQQNQKSESEHATGDTGSNMSVGRDSAGALHHNGSGASVDSNRIKVSSKKVKADVKTRQ